MEKRGLMGVLAVQLALVLLLILTKESAFGYEQRTPILMLATLVLGSGLFLIYLNYTLKLHHLALGLSNASAIAAIFVFITELAGLTLEYVTSACAALTLIALFLTEPEKIRNVKIIHHHTKEAAPKKKEEKLIGSTNGNKAHYQSCIVGRRIPKGKMIVFKDRARALEKGYKMCGLCVHKEGT